MRHITLIKITVVVIVAILVFQYFFLKCSAAILTHDYFPTQKYLTTLSNNYKIIQYTTDNYTINIEIPDVMDVHFSSDIGEQMRSNVYLVNSKLDFRGYIQIWKIEDLDHFLNNSKSLSPFDYKSYNIINVQQDKYHGFKIEWTANFEQNFISGKEYWLMINNSKYVTRISFFTDTADFPDELQNVIQQILNSLKIDKSNVI